MAALWSSSYQIVTGSHFTLSSSKFCLVVTSTMLRPRDRNIIRLTISNDFPYPKKAMWRRWTSPSSALQPVLLSWYSANSASPFVYLPQLPCASVVSIYEHNFPMMQLWSHRSCIRQALSYTPRRTLNDRRVICSILRRKSFKWITFFRNCITEGFCFNTECNLWKQVRWSWW